MKICRNDLLYAVSDALDCVEHELVGAMPSHGKRVAYITSQMAAQLKLDDYERLNLAAAAVLHDNALTEYIQTELHDGASVLDIKQVIHLGRHCTIGEENVSKLPFYDKIKGAVLFHHEEAAGTGPFGLKTKETPLFARMIHLADRVDVVFNLGSSVVEKMDSVYAFLKEHQGTVFDDEMVSLFLKAFPPEKLIQLERDNIETILCNSLPRVEVHYQDQELIGLSTIFAKIIDYKSDFTCKHSVGVAKKALAMGKYYNYDEAKQARLYLAGALHDIGKLMINTEILEKPDRLTQEEFAEIQEHALQTYKMLSTVKGFNDIADWASYHHEKLDGSGYPFGKKKEELGKEERLLACIDIYQALVEMRPYRAGMPHEQAMNILYSMAEQGKLDSQIVKDIDHCFAK
jgi:HD-GYP domain-containing protein (c-di-GMP phosphodiesterase class II)